MPPKNMSKERVEIEKNIILNSALDIVGEDGYRAISMRKIGARCNFSHAKIYYYFSNKDEILLSLVDNGFSILKNRLIEECEKQSTNKDKFITCLSQIYEFGINEPNYFNLMFGIEVPKCNDFLATSTLNKEAIAQKENAMAFYNYFSNTVKEYSSEMNFNITRDEILSVFIQVSGIVWLENAKLLKELDHDKSPLFKSTVNNIIKFIEAF